MHKSYFNSSDVFLVTNVAVTAEDGKGATAGLYVAGKTDKPSRKMTVRNGVTRIYIRKDPEGHRKGGA